MDAYMCEVICYKKLNRIEAIEDMAFVDMKCSHANDFYMKEKKRDKGFCRSETPRLHPICRRLLLQCRHPLVGIK